MAGEGNNTKGIPGVCRFCGGDTAGRRTACQLCHDWYVKFKNSKVRTLGEAEKNLLVKKALQSFNFDSRELLSPKALERYEEFKKRKTSIN